MKIKKVEIKNFRILENVIIDLDDNITLIVGRNNSGKTSLTEVFYKFFSGDKSRFRFEDFSLASHSQFIAANGLYAEYVAAKDAGEAETTLMGDNKGIGGGIISTVLINKLAVSFTGGIVKPFSYNEKQTRINYGNAYNYSLSFGYLIYPFKYKNFNQTNINFYAEFIGKSYDAMSITHHDKDVFLQNNKSYSKGNYIELRPAIQFIIKSNLRIDCSTAFPLVNKSYIRNYPLYMLNLQYYIFL